MRAFSKQEQALIESLQDRQQSMVATTRRLADINSGSFNPSGIDEVNRQLRHLFATVADTIATIALAPIPQVSDEGAKSAFTPPQMQIFSARTEAPLQLLCTGHSDTVFPHNSGFQSTWIAENHLRGPGVADMKGGLVVLLEALRAIDNSPFRERVGFTIAISPDEEIGSPSSAAELATLAQQAHFGLTYEPALADGTLAGARKGSGNFSFVVSGKSAHAGREFFRGRNALTAAARLCLALEAMSDETEGITVNIGKISGGGPVNVVPDTAVCRFNVRINDAEQQARMETKIAEVVARVEGESGCAVELHGNFNRPPKPVTAKQQALFDLLQNCGEQLDLDIRYNATGGCCEGNNLAAAGLVNIDTLGVRGGHIHSDKEFACLDSFVERAQLSALLIAKLCQQDGL